MAALDRKRNKHLLLYCISSSFFFFSLALSSSTTTCLDRRCLLSARPEYLQNYLQELESPKLGREQWLMMVKRRYLSGPGSSPPRCTSKCGKCIPCKAVHVPVPPGTPVTTEYYPEAWRCKCRNKLFIP